METQEAQKERIIGLFSRIAEGYDRANDRISFGMHRLWKRRLCRHLEKAVPPQADILDLCCGTGDVALMVADSCPGMRVVGADFTTEMLNIARRRGDGRENLRFVREDAMALSFPDEAFSAVTVAFGLRNTPDVGQALSEIHRVLKSSGSVLILESSTPENPLIRFGFHIFFSRIMPVLGGLREHREEYRWLNDSTWSFPSKERLTELIRRAGFRDVSVQSLLFGCAAIHTGTK